MTQLLEGIRVIDFGRFIAGPYAAMLLADFGADVIRVERRDGGEDRRVGPVLDSGEGALFLNLNRNKRGMTLDIGHQQARGILERLVRSADVVVVNLPLNLMQRLGLDYDALRAIKDNVILVMASAFGPDGPYRDRVGFDGVAQAMSGAMALSGFAETPVRSVVAFADYGTALHAAFGAMAALFERERTGRGQLVDVSLLATSVLFMAPMLIERAATGIRRQRQGNTAFYAAPSDAYRTRDGWILVPTIGDPMFRRWARLVGREDLLNDPRCRDDITRADHAELINAVMRDWCAARTRDEAIAELEAARIPCGPVYEPGEVLGDPQIQARKLFGQVDYGNPPKTIPISNSAVRLGGRPAPLRGPAPTLGQHTDEVLAELGFSDAEIARFRADGIV